MDNRKFTMGWLKFLFAYDHVGKVLFFISVVGLAMCTVDKFQHPVISLSMAALFLIAVGVSFFTYLLVGKYREARVNDFYDSIRYAGDLPTEYEGRNLKKIKIDWKWRRVRSLKLSVSTNSPAVQSDHEWRSIQRAARENFRFEEKNLLTFLEGHSSGVFVFRSASDEDVASSPEVSLALAKESMYAFAYDTLSSTGFSLPTITRFDIGMDHAGVSKPKSVEIRFEQQLSDYDMQRFVSGFNRKFHRVDAQWVFDWSASSVSIRALDKGSEEEQRINAVHSMNRLIESAVSTSFTLYDKEDWAFDADGMDWDGAAVRARQFSIDFLQSDVSRPDRIEEFEKLMRQGLQQLFPGTFWEFVWDVSTYRKAVFVRSIVKPALVQPAAPAPVFDEETIVAETFIPDDPDVAVKNSPVSSPAPVAPAIAARVKKAIPARPRLQGLPPRPPKLDI